MRSGGIFLCFVARFNLLELGFVRFGSGAILSSSILGFLIGNFLRLRNSELFLRSARLIGNFSGNSGAGLLRLCTLGSGLGGIACPSELLLLMRFRFGLSLLVGRDRG